MREVEKLLDEYTERAARFYSTLETSADLAEHVRIIMGYESELLALSGDSPEVKARRAAIEKEIGDQVSYAALNPAVQETLRQIAALREDVGARCGLAKEIAALFHPRRRLFHAATRTATTTTCRRCLGIACLRWPSTASPSCTTTDFESRVRNLLGGNLFESRRQPDARLSRIPRWRPLDRSFCGQLGLRRAQLQLILPFVRTLEQARAMRGYLDTVQPARRRDDSRSSSCPSCPAPFWRGSSSRSSTASPSAPTT
ncbi:MAG: hypothetical protein ACLSHC_15080 [Bilophila wadsworthia]